jgi:hypothetical protein
MTTTDTILQLVTVNSSGVEVFTNLPAPTSITVQDEIIWSADTGRVQDASMVGTVIAEKKNLKISWGILKESEMLQIKNSLTAGYPTVRFRDGDIYKIKVYRGTLTKEKLGLLSDGVIYYRSASVSIIQK